MNQSLETLKKANNATCLFKIFSDYPGPSQRLKKTVAIDTHKVLLKEKGVNLTLTIGKSNF